MDPTTSTPVTKKMKLNTSESSNENQRTIKSFFSKNTSNSMNDKKKDNIVRSSENNLESISAVKEEHIENNNNTEVKKIEESGNNIENTVKVEDDEVIKKTEEISEKNNPQKVVDEEKKSKKNKNEVKTCKALEDSSIKEVFESDKNDTSRLYCTVCQSRHKAVVWDLKQHLNLKSHKDNEEKKKNQLQTTMVKYMEGQEIARSEIIWSFLTVSRNLSFNFTDYASDYFPHMFNDSKIAQKITINRKKTKRIIEDVLLKTIEASMICNLRRVFSFSIDCSRDCSNTNQMILAVHYFDENQFKFVHSIFEIFEQNQTKGQLIFQTIQNQFNINRIEWKSVISVSTDSGSDFVGNKNGAIAHMLAMNKSIFHNTCICHKLDNLIKKVFSWLDDVRVDDSDSEGGEEDDSIPWNKEIEWPNKIPDVREFTNQISAYMNYSYKREDDYRNFTIEYLENKKKEGLYLSCNGFLQIKRYVRTRWLSLGKCIEDFLPQWEAFHAFLKLQIDKSKSKILKLDKRQKQNINEMIEMLSNNSFKFHYILMSFIIATLNLSNQLFQSESSQLHLLFSEIRRLFQIFGRIIMHDSSFMKDSDSPFEVSPSKWKLYKNEEFLEQINNYIDFSDPNLEFKIDLNKIDEKDILLAKELFKQALLSLVNYLPVNDEIIKAFQLLDPRKRNINQSIFLFREKLLKVFVSCYDRTFLLNEYAKILSQFTTFSEKKDEDLKTKLNAYQLSNDRINVEAYWIAVYKSEKEYLELSKFFLNLMTIQHSNCFVERMFSQVNLIKTSQRNLLDVSSVSSILKVKSFYSDYTRPDSELVYEPQEKDYYHYKTNIKPDATK